MCCLFYKLTEEKRGDRREITAVLDNMGQIRENKQEVIDVVYNFYADLYKGQNIGLDAPLFLYIIVIKLLIIVSVSSPCKYMLLKTSTKSFPIISKKRK
jgi:hypothetical protein